MKRLINTISYHTPLFIHDKTKYAKIIYAVVWIPAASSRVRTDQARSCLTWRGSFCELTRRINLSITADSVLITIFIPKLETEHNTTSCLHKLR